MQDHKSPCVEFRFLPPWLTHIQISCDQFIFSGPEVLFKTCIAMKFVDDDDYYY